MTTVPKTPIEPNNYYGKDGTVWSRFPENISSTFYQHDIQLQEVISSFTTPMQFFNYYFNSDMINLVVVHTNTKLRENNITQYVDHIEIQAFFGLLVILGCTRKKDIDVETIWKEDSLHNLSWASAAMSRDRFKLLSTFIRFDDINERQAQQQSGNRLCLVSELFNMFRKNLMGATIPGKDLCVDETLYGFRGRCPVTQYMKGKPNKFGIKFWSLAETKSKVLLDCFIYPGKNDLPETGLGEAVVKELVRPFHNSNRIVCADNFFTSYNLVDFLKKNGLGYIGTIRENKTCIPYQFTADKARLVGSSLFGFNNTLTLCSHVPKYNKSVMLLSSVHHQPLIDTNTNKPQMILDYNSKKCGVDCVDQMISKNSCQRKTNRWNMVVLSFILDICVHNSSIIYGMEWIMLRN